MKKMIALTTTLLLLYSGSLYAQDNNYLEESVRIGNIGRKSTALKIELNNEDGIPVVIGVDSAKFNKWVKTHSAQNSNVRPGEIAYELAYTLFLFRTDSPEGLKKIIKTCPKRFYHLEWIEKNIAYLQSSLENEKRSLGSIQGSPGFIPRSTAQTLGLAAQTSVSTGFAFSEAQIIYGIVDFTISRAKEQLVEVYLSNWYDKLNGNTFTKQMLPHTLGTLKAFNDDQSLNVAQYGDKWKAAFQEDLRSIPVLLQDEAFVGQVLDATGRDCPEKAEISAIVTGGSRLVYGLYLKKHLVTTINDMSADYLIKKESKPATFKRMTVLSDILLKAGGTLENNDSYKAVSVDDISQMDYVSWKTFLKLLFIRHHEALRYVSNDSIDALFPDLIKKEKIDKFAKLYRQTISVVTTYQKAVNVHDDKSTTELNSEETRKIFELGFQLTEQVVNYLPDIAGPNNDTVLKEAKKCYSALSQIGEGIASRRYGAVVDGTAGIISMLNRNEKLDTLIVYIQRYGSFMVNIISATDAAQVEGALEELIPKNLYKLKNTHSFTVSLSSYPGFFGGFEKISKFPEAADGQPELNKSKTSSWAFAPAVYLPIGIDLNFGKKRKTKHSDKFTSTNLFLQVLDLGAVLNYRITGSGSSEESDPNITFKQILSPGLGVMFHFCDSPFVLGATTSYTPSLRKVSQEGNVYNSNAFRFGLFVAVDVTYFNLFTSKKAAQ